MSTAARYKVGSGAVAIEDAVPSREGQPAMMMRTVRSGRRKKERRNTTKVPGAQGARQ